MRLHTEAAGQPLGPKSCRNIDKTWAQVFVTNVVLTGLLLGLSAVVISSPTFAGGTASSAATNTAPIELVMSPANDVVNLQFQGREAWDYDLARPDPSTITLRIPKLSENSKSSLLKFKSAWIKNVEVQNTTVEADTLFIHLQRQDVQSFDYMTDQPSRLVVDLFLPDESSSHKSKAASKGRSKNSGKNTVDKQAANERGDKKDLVQNKSLPIKNSRVPASIGTQAKLIETSMEEGGTGIADAGDPNLDRFAIKDYDIDPKAAIAAQRNIYVRFPFLKLDAPQLRDILKSPPIYEIKTEDSDESKQAQLVVGLYEKKRFGLVLRTLDLFSKAYPNSKYAEILGYIEADVHYEMYLKDHLAEEFEKAIGFYQRQVQNFPQSPLRKRTQLLIGFSQLNRGQSLNVIKTFEGFLAAYPDAPERFAAKLAIAEAYLKLNRHEEAREKYTELEKDKNAGEVSIQAAYVRGDTYINENQLKSAIKEYQLAQAAHPADWKNFPNAFYNRAEALFWSKNYKEALNSYREFLQRFPSSEHGGYAMTRIGECLEILGAPHQKVIGAYLEGIFRYRNTGGANFAMIRMLKDRMPEMKPKEVAKYIDEVREIQKHSTLPLMDDFVTVAIADGYFGRHENDKALKVLTDFYQATPNSPSLPIVRSRIVQVIASEIHAAAAKGDAIAAMQIYGTYASTWLKNVDRIDLTFDMASAFEKAGVPAEAERRYSTALAMLKQCQKDGSIKEREVFENIPTAEALDLRLAAVNIFAGKGERAKEFLSDIKNTEHLTAPQKEEWIELNASLNEQTGQLNAAAKFLKDMIEKSKGDPEQKAALYIRLAGIQVKAKNYKEAEQTYDQAAVLLETPDEVDERLADVLSQKAQLYERSNQTEKAIATLKSLIEHFGDERPLGSERYELGKLEFKIGEMKAAADAWNGLNKPETQFWYKLSQEQMSDSKWKDDYRRYLDKIPSMTNQKVAKDRAPANQKSNPSGGN